MDPKQLAQQLFNQAATTANNFFVKPAFQSPTPNVKAPTPFEELAGQAKEQLLKSHLLGHTPDWYHKFSPQDTPSVLPSSTSTPMKKTTAVPTATPTQSPITPTPTVGATPTPTSINGIDQGFVDLLNNKILPMTRQAGIPDAVVAAQAGAESGHGKSQIHRDDNNYLSLKFGGKMHHYESVENGVRDYILTVKSMVPNLDQIKNNPLEVLKALQGHKTGNFEGDNANPQQYVYDVSHTPEWQAYGGGQPLSVNPWGQ